MKRIFILFSIVMKVSSMVFAADCDQEKQESAGGAQKEVSGWQVYAAHHKERSPKKEFLGALNSFSKGQEAFIREAHPVAYDAGAGTGIETIELLKRGWTVVAIEPSVACLHVLKENVAKSELTPEERGRLFILTESFESLTEEKLLSCCLEPPLFISGQFSFSFCPPQHFEGFWKVLTGVLRAEGLICGQLFGDQHTWASTRERDMSFFSKEQVEKSCQGFIKKSFEEVDFQGTDVNQKKVRWYYFDVEYQKPGKQESGTRRTHTILDVQG